MSSKWHKGTGGPAGDEHYNLVTQLPIGLDEEQNAVVDGFGTLKARMLGGGFEGTVAFHPRQDPIFSTEVTHALGTGQGKASIAIMQRSMLVRRLTPLECERLQGFPDGHSAVPWRGKSAPDSLRYKAMGNSMAVPVMRAIGERIAMVDARSRGG